MLLCMTGRRIRKTLSIHYFSQGFVRDKYKLSGRNCSFFFPFELYTSPIIFRFLFNVNRGPLSQVNGVRFLIVLCFMRSSGVILTPVRGTKRKNLKRLLRNCPSTGNVRPRLIYHFTSTRRKCTFNNNGAMAKGEFRKVLFSMMFTCRLRTNSTTLRTIILLMGEGRSSWIVSISLWVHQV